MKQLAEIIKCFVRPHSANSSQAHIRFIKLLWRRPADDIHIYAPPPLYSHPLTFFGGCFLPANTRPKEREKGKKKKEID